MAQVNFPTLDSMADNIILYAQRQRQNGLSYMAQSQPIASSPISYLRFIMTIVIVISFACERKTVLNVCVPELRAE